MQIAHLKPGDEIRTFAVVVAAHGDTATLVTADVGDSTAAVHRKAATERTHYEAAWVLEQRRQRAEKKRRRRLENRRAG